MMNFDVDAYFISIHRNLKNSYNGSMKKFVYAILSLLVFFTPLIFSPRSSELFEFPKLLFIYFGASLLFPLLIFNFDKLKRQLLKPKNQNWRLLTLVMSLFLLSQILSTVFSIDSHVSFFGYYSRFNGGVLSLISYFTIFLSALLFLNKERVINLLKIMLIGGIVVALWGLPSHFGFDFICLMVIGNLNTSCWTADFIPQLRLFSTLGQPNWLATYLLVLIAFVLYKFITGQSLLPKKFKQYAPFLTSLLFLLFSIELYWTNSRSGLLAYIVLVFGFFITYFLSQKNKFKKLLKSTLYLPLITIFLVIVLSAWPFLSSRFNTMFIKKEVSITQTKEPLASTSEYKITPSSDIRLLVWQGALKLAQKYPLFGTGVETYAYSYNFTRPAEHNLTSEWNYVYNKAHNELLNYLATTGWLGLVSYLLMFATFVYPAFNTLLKTKQVEPEIRDFSLFYLGAMISIFIMNFFGFSTTVTSLLFYLLPALFLVFVNEPVNQNVASTTTESSLSRQLSFGQLSVYFVWLLFSFIYLLNYFTADYHYARAREHKQVQDFTNAYISGQKALDLRREPTYLDQQAGIAANLAALQQIQRNNPQAKQFSQQAISYNNETLSLSPKNVFYYKTRAKIFYALSMSYIDNQELSADYLFKAVQALETAATLAPSDAVIPFTLASLVQQTEPDRALELLRTVVTLKPDYKEAENLIKQLQNQ